MQAKVLILTISALIVSHAPTAAAEEKGAIIQTDTLGMNLVTRNLDKGTTTTVADAANLSEFVGIHEYFSDTVRLGANFQFTERIAPTPAHDASRLQAFAVLPQVGWAFSNPFFAALVFTCAPRTDGVAKLTLGLQGVIGAALPVSERIKLSLALEVPWNFHPVETIGLTPLVGIAVRL